MEVHVKATVKLQALVYDILPTLEEGAGKRCSECAQQLDYKLNTQGS